MVSQTGLIWQLASVGIGTVSGIGAYFAGMPLPWMLGAMLGNTVFALAGVPLAGPLKLRPYVLPILGVMLGSAVTSDLFSQMGGWVVTLVLLPIYLFVAASLSFLVYHRIGKYDLVTAFYSAMPGGLNEMLVLGAEAGGEERKIALAHAARVLLVILFVALFFGLVLGVRTTASTANWIALTAPSLPDYGFLVLAAVLGIWLGAIAKLPASRIFGPMIVSGAFHFAHLVEIAPPTVFVIAAQIVIGSIIGTRFVGATLSELRRDLSLAVLATAVMLCVAIVFAEVIVFGASMAHSQSFLAFAPGGLTEMSLLALAMDQDVAYVSTIHIVRITVVIAVAPLFFGVVKRRLNRSGGTA